MNLLICIFRVLYHKGIYFQQFQIYISINLKTFKIDSNIIYNLSTLPDHVLALRGDDFYAFVKSMVGSPLHDILKIQSIDSSQSLLDTNDIFEIFKYNSPDLLELKTKSCF
jgi:hypothetical protein